MLLPRQRAVVVAKLTVMNVLVIGGAGYIGSHCVRQLALAGHQPVVLDNLSLGHRAAVPPTVPFHLGDLADGTLVRRILTEHRIELVMHFAAYAAVGESVEQPLRYYRNNVAGPINLLSAMKEVGVRKFVFSSSCTVFGDSPVQPITEDLPRTAISPYGQTKLDIEHLLEWVCPAEGISAAIFRYFNAAGAADDASMGEDHSPETHLIPLAIAAALGRRPALRVFGTDYPTPDGTCLRDYVHVDDLSRAHIAVFERLAEAGVILDYNLGTGTPTSVREIIRTVEEVSGLPVPHVDGPRRAGDAPAAYADNRKAVRDLDWKLQYPDCRSIIESAWRWHQVRPHGYNE